MKVLFVCSGNTCRSPMAQAIYQHLTGEEASSGGLGVIAPEPVSDYAIKALEELGITGFSHVSRQITVNDVTEADRVYVMTALHRRVLVAVCPEQAEKIRLLGGDRDISDPFGQDQDTYSACCREIEECIRRELA